MMASVPLKIRVLDILHDCGKCTTRQICDELYGKDRSQNCSSVGAHLRKMELDGLIVRSGKNDHGTTLWSASDDGPVKVLPERRHMFYTVFYNNSKTGRIEAEIYGGLEEARKSAEDPEKMKSGAVVRIKSVEARM